jgi:hypothetical protein
MMIFEIAFSPTLSLAPKMLSWQYRPYARGKIFRFLVVWTGFWDAFDFQSTLRHSGWGVWGHGNQPVFRIIAVAD